MAKRYGCISNEGYVDDQCISSPSPVPTAPKKQLRVPDAGITHRGEWSGTAGDTQWLILGEKGLSTSDQGQVPLKQGEKSVLGLCGYCCWTPAVLQRLASGRFFVLFLGLLSLAEAGLTIGYIGSMVTTVELQFRFSSTLTGFVTSCYDIGTLVVIFTSYFGGRAAANRPKWIAWSAWVMALGSSIVTLPHFFITYAARVNGTASSVCHDSRDASEKPVCQSGREDGIEGSSLLFLIPGMLLIGAGSTTTLTLGTTYIDDFVRKNETSILLALFTSATVIGPAFGFAIGSLFLKHYVDFEKVSATDVNISPSSPRWVGAWWLGFFFFAGLISVTAVPVYAFPANLEKPKEGQLDAEEEETQKKKGGSDEDDAETCSNVRMAFNDVSLKKIPSAILGLLRNPVYMLINVAAAAEFSVVTGFVRFMPKFVESQFTVTATTANLLTGTLIPVGALGVVLGGFILTRVKSDLLTTVNVLSFSTATAGFLFIFMYMPGPCNTLAVAGVTSSYSFGDPNWHVPSDPYNVNLTSDCNAPCQCDVTKYRPICSTAGVSYFSPCFAGCQLERTYSDGYEYTNCSCVQNYNGSALLMSNVRKRRNKGRRFDGRGRPLGSRPREAATGLCESDCGKLVPFMALLLLVVFTSSLQQMPAIMSLLRCVQKEERPLALGIQFVVLRLVGFIPSPAYYGALIDSACILWERECGSQSGTCLQYNNRDFFYRFLGLSTGLKLFSVFMVALARLVLVRRRRQNESLVTQSSPSSGYSDMFSTESQKNDRLSHEISTLSRFRYTDEVDPRVENQGGTN